MTENRVIEILTDKHTIFGTTICDDIVYKKLKLAIKTTIISLKKLQAINEHCVVKKPIGLDRCACPSCGTCNEIIKKQRNIVDNDIVFCWHCGQRMEISKVEVICERI